MLDFAIPVDQKMKIRTSEKINPWASTAISMTVVGALGMVSKYLEE